MNANHESVSPSREKSRYVFLLYAPLFFFQLHYSLTFPHNFPLLFLFPPTSEYIYIYISHFIGGRKCDTVRMKGANPFFPARENGIRIAAWPVPSLAPLAGFKGTDIKLSRASNDLGMQRNVLRAASFQGLQRRFFKKYHVRVRFAPSPTGNDSRARVSLFSFTFLLVFFLFFSFLFKQQVKLNAVLEGTSI